MHPLISLRSSSGLHLTSIRGERRPILSRPSLTIVCRADKDPKKEPSSSPSPRGLRLFGGCPCCGGKVHPKTSKNAREGEASTSSSNSSSSLSRRTLFGATAAAAGSLPKGAKASTPEARIGFYDRYFAIAMRDGMVDYEAEVADRKKKLFAKIPSGSRVLEVGVGTAPNLKYYPKSVNLAGIDPNPVMLEFAQESAKSLGRSLETRTGNALQMPFPDSSMDVVVCTLVLCSVDKPNRVLKEIARVLKPGGKFLFIEHVIDPESGARRTLQYVFNPLQSLLADGCNITRDTLATIEKSGLFSKVDADRFEVSDYFIGPHIAGIATLAK